MQHLKDSSFSLHAQLAADTIFITDWPLCRVLLMNDANYPWLILVPRRNDIREIYQLAPADQAQLLQESSALGEVLMKEFSADKLNIAALGNMVPQLHIHHVLRFAADIAWPKPVWGVHPAKPYPQHELDQRVLRLRELLETLS